MKAKSLREKEIQGVVCFGKLLGRIIRTAGGGKTATSLWWVCWCGGGKYILNFNMINKSTTNTTTTTPQAARFGRRSAEPFLTA